MSRVSAPPPDNTQAPSAPRSLPAGVRHRPETGVPEVLDRLRPAAGHSEGGAPRAVETGVCAFVTPAAWTVAIIRLLLLTGCRFGEIAALDWDWIKGGRIHLPDSKSGPRTVWLSNAARAVIDAVPRYSPECPYVFPGRPADRPTGDISNDWGHIRREAGLPDVRLHDLRTFASQAVMSGENLPLAGRLLGHRTTAGYAHLADDHLVEAAERVGDTIAKAMGRTTSTVCDWPARILRAILCWRVTPSVSFRYGIGLPGLGDLLADYAVIVARVLYRSLPSTSFAECSIDAMSSASVPPRTRKFLAASCTSGEISLSPNSILTYSMSFFSETVIRRRRPLSTREIVA